MKPISAAVFGLVVFVNGLAVGQGMSQHGAFALIGVCALAVMALIGYDSRRRASERRRRRG